MMIVTYIAIIWFSILLIIGLYFEMKYYIEKKYYDKLKQDFENAWCDEQILEMVYNTFKLKQKRK